MSNSVNWQEGATAQRLIPQTDVETETLLNPLKYLAYLCHTAEDACVVVRPLNERHFESWSNSKLVGNIANRDLIITIEMIKDEMILGVDEDLDDQVIKVGVKLILESQGLRYDLGPISSIYRFSKEIPYPKRSPKECWSVYRKLFDKYVKRNLLAHIRSKFYPASSLSRSDQLHTTIPSSLPSISYKITLFDGDWFTGDFSGSLTGEGKYTKPNGEVYLGHFIKGFLSEGNKIYPDGDYLNGKFNKEEGFTGRGKYTTTNGWILEGEFSDGVLVEGTRKSPISFFMEEGIFTKGKLVLGKKTYSNDMVQEGTFEEGSIVQGKTTYSNGAVEEGIFEEGSLVRGKITYSNGTVEEGIFVEGELVQGRETHLNGYWREGIFLGYGIIMDSEGSTAQGMFERGKLSGDGTINYSNGSTCKGKFENGKLIFGKQTHPDQSWVEGVFEGEGERQHSDGSIETGTFEDRMLADGKQVLGDGYVIEGTFEQGKLILGKITLPDQSCVEGVFEGIGERRYSDGSIETGTFEDRMLADGKQVFGDGHVIEGTFEQGKLVLGKVIYPDGSWEEGVFIGDGKRRDSNGVTGEGSFLNGQLVYGKITKLDTGDWEEGTFEGKGERRDSQGRFLEGVFESGQLIKGKITLQSEETLEGTFQGEGRLDFVGKGINLPVGHTILEGVFENGKLIEGKIIPPDGIMYSDDILDLRIGGEFGEYLRECRQKLREIGVSSFIFPGFIEKSFSGINHRKFNYDADKSIPVCDLFKSSDVMPPEDVIMEAISEGLRLKFRKKTVSIDIIFEELKIEHCQIGNDLMNVADREDIRICLFNEIRDAFIREPLLVPPQFLVLNEIYQKKLKQFNELLSDILDYYSPDDIDSSANEEINYYKIVKLFDGLLTNSAKEISILQDPAAEKIGIKGLVFCKVFQDKNCLKTVFQALEQARADLNNYCKNREAYTCYCEVFLGYFPPGLDSLKMFVELRNLPIFIWKQSRQSSFLKLKNPSSNQLDPFKAVHLLYSDSNHFDLLEFDSPPDRCRVSLSSDRVEPVVFTHERTSDFKSEDLTERPQVEANQFWWKPEDCTKLIYHDSLHGVDLSFDLIQLPRDQDSGFKILGIQRLELRNLLIGLSKKEDIRYRLLHEIQLAFQLSKSNNRRVLSTALEALNKTAKSLGIDLENLINIDQVNLEALNKLAKSLGIGPENLINIDQVRIEDCSKDVDYYHTEEAYLGYCNALLHDLPLGCESAIIFAEKENRSIYIWERVVASDAIIITHSFKASQIAGASQFPQSTHLLHSESHFDRLVLSAETDENWWCCSLEEKGGDIVDQVARDRKGKLLLKDRGMVKYLKGDGNQLSTSKRGIWNTLEITKMIDFLMRKRGYLKSYNPQALLYAFVQKILSNDYSQITSCAAYTHSLNPSDWVNLDYVEQSTNWLDERVARQAKLMIDQQILARSLAERMKGTWVATRGNTGVGKSFWIHRILNEYLKENEHLIHGVLNPDHLKAILKKIDGVRLLNSQVYLEGRIVFERLLRALTEEADSLVGAIVDTRLLTIKEFREVLALADKSGASLEIVDVDASIWNSILAVLNRAPFGKDPCVSFDVIRDGYVRARTYREEFIQASMDERVSYSLYYLTKEGSYLQVAGKREGETCLSTKESIFDECLRVPTEEEMQETAQILITPEWIDSLEVSRSKEGLRKWIGFTIAEALDNHRLGKEPNQAPRMVSLALSPTTSSAASTIEALDHHTSSAATSSSAPSEQLFLGLLEGRGISFKKEAIEGDGNCGFYALGTNREILSNVLASLSDDSMIRNRLWNEVSEAFIYSWITPPKSVTLLEERYKQHTTYDTTLRKIRDHHSALPQFDAKVYRETVLWLESAGELEAANRLKQAYLARKEAEVNYRNYCKSKEAYLIYCKAYQNRLWLGCESALIFAEQKNIALFIWEHSAMSGRLQLKASSSTGNLDQSKTLHLLFSNGNHFDRLIPL